MMTTTQPSHEEIVLADALSDEANKPKLPTECPECRAPVNQETGKVYHVDGCANYAEWRRIRSLISKQEDRAIKHRARLVQPDGLKVKNVLQRSRRYGITEEGAAKMIEKRVAWHKRKEAENEQTE